MGSDQAARDPLDDSIWDIEKAYKKHERARTGPRSNPLVTYSKKQKKKITGPILPSHLTRPVTTSTTKDQQASLYSSTKKPTQPTLTQKRTSKDKGKGKAVDVPRPQSNIKSLSLSKRKATATASSSKPATTSSAAASRTVTVSSAPAASASTSKATTASAAAATSGQKGTENELPRAEGEMTTSTKPMQPTPLLRASTQRDNLFETSTPRRFPVSSSGSNNNALTALTLSPIRPVGDAIIRHPGMAEAGMLQSTPITHLTRSKRVLPDNPDEEENDNNPKRLRTIAPPKSPTRRSNDNNVVINGNNKNDDDGEEEPYLSAEQLDMTVEHYLRSLVDREIEEVKKRGEKYVQAIEAEVSRIRQSILSSSDTEDR